MAVAVPLTIHTIEVFDDRNFTRQALAGVERWDPNGEVVELTADARGNDEGYVEVVVTTSTEPVPAWRYAAVLREETGRRVTVDVEYLVRTGDAAIAD